MEIMFWIIVGGYVALLLQAGHIVFKLKQRAEESRYYSEL